MEFTCDQCKATFTSARALRGHIMGKHENNIKQELTTEKRTLTPEEAAIVARSQSEDTAWHAIREDEMQDHSLSNNPFSISNYPEAQKMIDEKRYVFRWCERTPQRIDELTRASKPPYRWSLVTRTTAPFMEQYIDVILGCVCQGDQALLFKPYGHAEIVRRQKEGLANARGEAAKPENAIGKHISDKIVARSGKEFAIKEGQDIVEFEDTDGVGDLVVEE